MSGPLVLSSHLTHIAPTSSSFVLRDTCTVLGEVTLLNLVKKDLFEHEFSLKLVDKHHT